MGMKRLLALLTGVMMTLAATAAAEEAIGWPENAVITDYAALGEELTGLNLAQDVRGGLRGIEDALASLAARPVTEPTDDRVSVGKDGTVTVVADGVSISVMPPFGTIAFGQDAKAQPDVYGLLGDPEGVVRVLKSRNAHVCVLDLAFQTEIYAVTGHDAVSDLIEDIDGEDTLTLRLLASRLQKETPDADVLLLHCGGKAFLVFDYRRGGWETVVYTSVKNHTNIAFMLVPGDGAITDFEVDVLEILLADAVLAGA